MAINFPDSPSDNDIYTVNGKRWIYSSGKWSIYGTTAPDATASDTEPSGVGDGHIWYRSDESQTLIRYDNTWVEVGSAGGFDNASTSFPTSLDSATGFAAVEALQAKVGADSSAVTSSLDYKVAQLEAISHGKILQVLQTTKVDAFSTTSTSNVDITGYSVSITPTSATSKILVMCQIAVGHSANGANCFLTLVRDSTDIFLTTVGSFTTGTIEWNNQDAFSSASVIPFPIIYLDSPATTSATTYKVQTSTSTGTQFINRSATGVYGGTSSITVLEVSA
jgi:hypothetical protein